jgi:hypothetical protein
MSNRRRKNNVDCLVVQISVKNGSWKKTTCIILAYAIKEQKYRSGKVVGGTKTAGKYINT